MERDRERLVGGTIKGQVFTLIGVTYPELSLTGSDPNDLLFCEDLSDLFWGVRMLKQESGREGNGELGSHRIRLTDTTRPF